MKIVWITLVLGAALLSGCATVTSAADGGDNILQRESSGSRPVHHDFAI